MQPLELILKATSCSEITLSLVMLAYFEASNMLRTAPLIEFNPQINQVQLQLINWQGAIPNCRCILINEAESLGYRFLFIYLFVKQEGKWLATTVSLFFLLWDVSPVLCLSSSSSSSSSLCPARHLIFSLNRRISKVHFSNGGGTVCCNLIPPPPQPHVYRII